MQIKDVLQEKGAEVITIDPDQTIHAGIVDLNRHGIGALMVVDKDGRIVGIVTERDILHNCGENCTHSGLALPRSQNPCTFLVRDIMTRDLIIGVPDDDLNYVMGVMTKHRIRHLPILEDGNLAGIISISDLVNAHIEENVIESRTLKDYIQTWGHTL